MDLPVLRFPARSRRERGNQHRKSGGVHSRRRVRETEKGGSRKVSPWQAGPVDPGIPRALAVGVRQKVDIDLLSAEIVIAS
jgi:hypothetical protein